MAFSLAYTLTAGTPEDVTQLMSNLTGLRDNVNEIADSYRTIRTQTIRIASGSGLDIYVEGASDAVADSASTASRAIFYLDPADYAMTGCTTKYRVRATLVTGTSSENGTFTSVLYPVTAVSGGAASMGSPTAGSTVAIAAPTGNTMNQGNSGDFTAPSAGYYALAVSLSVASAVGDPVINVSLQVRNV